MLLFLVFLLVLLIFQKRIMCLILNMQKVLTLKELIILEKHLMT